MDVRWTARASADFYKAVKRIAQENPDAAIGLAKTLYDGIMALRDFPKRAPRSPRSQDTRELVFPSPPYTAVYRVRRGAVEVLHVYRQSQDWPSR